MAEKCGGLILTATCEMMNKLEWCSSRKEHESSITHFSAIVDSMEGSR